MICQKVIEQDGTKFSIQIQKKGGKEAGGKGMAGVMMHKFALLAAARPGCLLWSFCSAANTSCFHHESYGASHDGSVWLIVVPPGKASSLC